MAGPGLCHLLHPPQGEPGGAQPGGAFVGIPAEGAWRAPGPSPPSCPALTSHSSRPQSRAWSGAAGPILARPRTPHHTTPHHGPARPGPDTELLGAAGRTPPPHLLFRPAGRRLGPGAAPPGRAEGPGPDAAPRATHDSEGDGRDADESGGEPCTDNTGPGAPGRVCVSGGKRLRDRDQLQHSRGADVQGALPEGGETPACIVHGLGTKLIAI